MSIFNSQRIFKQQTREMAVDFPYRSSALFLPAAGAKCVLLAQEKGMIDKNTKLQLVERNTKTAAQLSQTMSDSGLNYMMHNTDLTQVELVHKLDYAWIDLNGTISQSLAIWIENELQKNLNDNSYLCLTHEFAWRNNQWLKDFREKELNNPEYLKFRIATGIYSGEFTKLLAFPAYLISKLLNNWKITLLSDPFRYADRTLEKAAVDMVFYRFSLNKKQSYVQKISTNVVEKSVRPVSKERKMKSILTAAVVINAIYTAKSPAQKAHATRKLNAYVATRVEEGKKESQVRAAIAAHVTRRRQAV